MRGPFNLLLIAGVVYGMAALASDLLLPEVVPVASAEGPQPLWALELAFVLRSIENVAVLTIFIVVLATVIRWLTPAEPKPRN